MTSRARQRPRVGVDRGRVGALAQRGTRAFGMATARWRSDPDFLVIGAKRGGTTSFYFDLIEHPDVCPLFPAPGCFKREATKGIHYFDSNYWRGERWYRSYLPTRRARARAGGEHRVVVGEASPYYLGHPAAATRVARTLPKVKIIVLLRDPVERAYSHWKERRRALAEPLTFTEAIAAEASRVGDAHSRLLADAQVYSYEHEHYGYVHQSRYGELLAPWIANVDSSRFLFLASEEYYSDPVATMRSVEAFLGIRHVERTPGEHRNATAESDLPADVAEHLRLRFVDDTRALATMVGRQLPWPVPSGLGSSGSSS